MTSPPPPWQAHNAAGYDSTMTARCTKLQAEIIADPVRRQTILSDPRDLHRELFGSFAPVRHEEYAGCYRGTPGTSLSDRRIHSASQLEPSRRYEFCLPGEVPARMDQLLQQTLDLLSDASTEDFGKLLALTYTFCWFGKIHPFLDGNGHVQRAIFAAMATEFGYPLSARFAIHPRPYDRLLATALEIFTRAPVGQEMGEVGLVAEYLAFFLNGPFNAVRKHVSTASPYAT
jgi:fido (protein-threonine AMPylation protein)